MATLATATEKKAPMNADEKPERKPQRGRVDDKFKIFCGTANELLCDEVCALPIIVKAHCREAVVGKSGREFGEIVALLLSRVEEIVLDFVPSQNHERLRFAAIRLTVGLPCRDYKPEKDWR